MWSENFGETLKRIRNERGLLQADLAERMGVSQQAISQWEREKEWPKLQTIERLAAALHVSPETLLAGKSKEEAMTLRELIESCLVKDDHNLMIHVPMYGNVRQIKCGKWFEDQILDLHDRKIDKLTFNGSEWDIELSFWKDDRQSKRTRTKRRTNKERREYAKVIILPGSGYGAA